MNEMEIDSDYAEILQVVQSGKNLDEILKEFKSYLHKIRQDGDDDVKFKSLLSLYFLLEPKHPVKSLIQNFFNQIGDKRNDAVMVFEELLKAQIKRIRNDENVLASGYKLVSHLNELSQNFEVAIIAVGKSFKEILSFLNELIKIFILELTNELSPSRKSETSHRLHNSFQVYIFCVRSCIRQYNEDIQFCDCIDELPEIYSNIDIGMDSKNIFAMLIVMRNNQLSRNDHMLEITDVDENIQKRLCLMSGVIQSIDRESIDDLDIFVSILEDIFNKNSVDNGIVYTVSRILAQIIKKLLTYKNLDDLAKIENITRIATSLSVFNLEHNVESVRYLSKETFKSLIELGSKIPNGDDHVDKILAHISSLPIELKASAVTGIHQVMPVGKILEKMPNLLDMLLQSIENNKECKVNCYFALSSKASKEVPFEKWYETFIQRITKKLSKENNDDYLIFTNLLLKCIKKDTKALEMILRQRSEFDIKFNLMLLKLAKDEGILETSNDDESLWRGIISYEEIKNAMVNFDSDVRLSAICLIVDTKKMTEEFSHKEIDCLLYFFKANVSLQISSTKQTLVGIVKRIFTRLRGNVQASIRRNDKQQVVSQFKVLVKFHKFAIENLLSKANFSRRSLSLVILINIQEAVRQHFPQEIESFWNEESFCALFNVLHDAYESNKEKAMEVMSYIPKKLIIKYSSISLENLEQLHKSIRPADSLTAIYLMQFCLKFSIIPPESLNVHESLTLNLLMWCEKELLEAMELAEKSIIVAAGSNPLYGFIASMRSIISKLNLKELLDDPHWKSFLNRLLSTTKRLTAIASPIVNASSPEGIYPGEDFAILMNGQIEKDMMKIVENTTPQMILLCAWRIIKEVSLLLGDLSLKAVECSQLFTIDQLINIGYDFLELMTNIKHRGAFEQCFTGFSQYCTALRSSHCFELHNFPQKILTIIMDSITQKADISDDKSLKGMKNLCATRRSAGLPFIIQALLSSEIKISKSENFHGTMRSLLRSAQFGEELEVRIHSLNILRVLYKCKELNDVINEYICEGLKCSILGIGSNQWAERNSSTLLFSSLMIRTFGVQRNKDSDQIDIKNKMSSKIFFLRYPELYDFFMEQLSESVEYVMQQKRNAKLFPLLLILNRLFTSPSETCESNLKLVNFIPTVVLCSGCVDLKARVLCAKFVANVNPVQLSLQRVAHNIDILEGTPGLTTNFKHGRLLEILHLVKNLPKTQVDHNLECLESILNDLIELLKSFRNEIICFSTILDVIMSIFEVSSSHKLWARVGHEKLQTCFDFNSLAYFGIPAMQNLLTALQLIQLRMRGQDFFINYLDSTKSSEGLIQNLNSFILMLCDINDHETLIEKYEIDSKVRFVVIDISDEEKEKLRNNLKASKKLSSLITKLTLNSDVAVQARAFEIISHLNVDEQLSAEKVNNLLEDALSKPDEYKAAIVHYAAVWIEKDVQRVHSVDWKIFLEFSHSSFDVKLSLIKVLKVCIKFLHQLTLKTKFFYTSLLVNLLMDDDFDVSRAAAEIVSEVVDSDQIFIPSHAIETFIGSLLSSLKESERIVLVGSLAVWQESSNMEEDAEEDSNEFQIFDKTEENSSQEMFIFKDILWRFLETLKFDGNEAVQEIQAFLKEVDIEAHNEAIAAILDQIKST